MTTRRRTDRKGRPVPGELRYELARPLTIHLRADGTARVEAPGGHAAVLGPDAVNLLFSLRRGGIGEEDAIRRSQVAAFPEPAHARVLAELATLGFAYVPARDDAGATLVAGEESSLRRALPAGLFSWLRRRGALPQGCVALDLGCGTGRVALELARGGACVTAVDASPRVVAALRESARKAGLAVDVLHADACHPPVPDGSVQLVVLDQLLPFVPPLAALEAAAEALCAGGTLVVVANEVRVSRGRGKGHVVSPASTLAPARVLRALGWRRVGTHRSDDRQVFPRELYRARIGSRPSPLIELLDLDRGISAVWESRRITAIAAIKT